MFVLSDKSLLKLVGVHQDLCSVVKTAIKLSRVDFSIGEGVRSIERQRELVAQGKSKTLNSRHLTGHAVDLFAWPEGKLSWDLKWYKLIAEAMFTASMQLSIPLRWGGDWNQNGRTDDEKFLDAVHFELLSSRYP